MTNDAMDGLNVITITCHSKTHNLQDRRSARWQRLDESLEIAGQSGMVWLTGVPTPADLHGFDDLERGEQARAAIVEDRVRKPNPLHPNDS
ncbi:hypothetical protein GPX89_34770 [Nocardia sp. ET3-3]|uniref:Uncharacterized protein n=1 Tax=Nocardia terrae TaxID=2675851 RepID=A0A7K1V7F2_9NOCA|nr:hypothetical protein [Nocardia terrae]MVU82382.1 hypothetical protein [Nocardia terrae]